MILKKYEELPGNMQNDAVRMYYEILKNKKTSFFIKRIFDIFFAFVLLVLFLPIFLILALLIKLDSKGTVFFRQDRVTTYGKIFRIYKFRTMVQDADKKGSLVTEKEDSRITKVGSFIRKLRLDEIPQLLNVLSGDMSFVGTRPEVKKYVDKYSDDMLATLLMPAGITSIASIKYKDEDEIISKMTQKGKSIDEAYVDDVLPEKMKYNLEYIEKFSILEDIKICLRTVKEVLC